MVVNAKGIVPFGSSATGEEKLIIKKQGRKKPMTESILKLQQAYMEHCSKFASEGCSKGECGLSVNLCEAIGAVLREKLN